MSRKSYPNVNAANQYARDVVRGKVVAKLEAERLAQEEAKRAAEEAERAEQEGQNEA